MTARIVLDGPNSSRALDQLLAIPGLQAERVTPPEPKVVYRSGVLEAVGQIVSIAGGLATIAQAIIAWRDQWLNGRGGRQMTAVLESPDGTRLTLHDATEEQVARVLKGLMTADANAVPPASVRSTPADS